MKHSLDRRVFVRLTVAGACGGVVGAVLGYRRGAVGLASSGTDPHAEGANARADYAHAIEPPRSLGPTSLDSVLRPPVPTRPSEHRRTLELWASEQPVEVANGRMFAAWTYNGTVPGPILRATEGEELAIHFRNLGAHPHNVHFHGSHDPSQDGWEPVPPGGEAVYRLTADPFGVHPYHCHAHPISDHVAKGLYGVMIVDPPGGRPPAHEFALLLSGFDLDGDGKSEIYGWNGVGGFFERFPIKVPAGDLVRVYLCNMAWNDPFASFHLHGQTFELFRSGTRLRPDETTDVVMLGPSERAIVEFRLPKRGRYMFHPHQSWMAERGAMGWFAAI